MGLVGNPARKASVMSTLKIQMAVGTTVITWPALQEPRLRAKRINVTVPKFRPANDQAETMGLRAGLRLVASR